MVSVCCSSLTRVSDCSSLSISLFSHDYHNDNDSLNSRIKLANYKKERKKRKRKKNQQNTISERKKQTKTKEINQPSTSTT